jgi:putative spermidine/putrescine transport system ATP-binding protein
MLDLIYFGDHLRVRCEVAGQEPATIKMALAHAALPQPSQTFQVYAPPEHLRVYR